MINLRTADYTIYPEEFSSLEDFIKTGYHKHCFDKSIVVKIPNDNNPEYAYSFIVKDGLIYQTNYDNHTFFNAKRIEKDKIPVICGVKLPNEPFWLLNADEHDDSGVEQLAMHLAKLKLPCTSFRCLARFFYKGDADKYIERLAKRIIRGDIDLLDYTTGDIIKKRWSKKTEIQMNLKGYTHNGGSEWHKPGNCLFCDQNNKFILTGQDEGSFFGCELQDLLYLDQEETVDGAIKSLVPYNKIGKGEILGRQGEWFVVKARKTDVPSVKDAVAFSERMVLPLDSENSNRHVIDSVGNDDLLDTRVSKTGQIFATRFALTHDDHETITCPSNTWCTFYKNTAKRSFSVEGVD